MKISKNELCQIIDESISLAINDFALREGLVTRNTVNKRALNQLNESFMDNFKDLRNQLAGLFKKNNKVKTAIQNAINFINQAKEQLEGEAQKDIESIGNVLSSLAQPILGQPQYESLQTMLSQKNVSKKELKKAIDNAINEASQMNNIDLNESMRRLNEGIGDKFRNLLNAIKQKPGVKDLLLKAKQSIESILNMLTGQAQQDMNAIVQVLGAAAGQFNQQSAQQQPQQPAQPQQNQTV